MITPDDYLDRGITKGFDFTLVGMTALLCALGVVTIYSANLQSESSYMQGLYIRQIYWIGICLPALIVCAVIDFRFLERMAYPLYLIGIASLFAVSFSGRLIGGSKRWLSIAGFNLQPSEIMKILLIILLARIFDEMRQSGALGFKNLIKPAIFVAIPFFIVAKQPDLGTALIFVLVFGGMALFNGISRRLLTTMAIGLPIIAPLFWLFLKPYHKKRIIALLNPEADPMGQGYHIIQSKIAVGSGGTWGKGIFEGTQSKLNFLPAKHTDFIFSVFAEEVGFFGSILLILLFFFFIMKLVEIILYAKDKFASLIVVGIVTMLTFNFLYNLGMTIGLFPIVGIPLPFISYGGSSLLVNFIAVGLALNVSLSRYRLD